MRGRCEWSLRTYSGQRPAPYKISSCLVYFSSICLFWRSSYFVFGFMKRFEPIPVEIERIAKEAVDSAFKIHKTLGPGLLESVYQVCMVHELSRRGFHVKPEEKIPVIYDGLRLDADLRLDLLIENRLLIELKAVDQMSPIFQAQLMTYMKLLDLRLGLLINFNVPLIKDGIKRVII